MPSAKGVQGSTRQRRKDGQKQVVVAPPRALDTKRYVEQASCPGLDLRAQFIHQPLSDGIDLAQFLTTVLSDEEINGLLVVVAWAKRSGLRLFEGTLTDFRARGGRASLLVGVSEGGATRQGLELAMRLFDEVWVVHDVSGRTFHPKVYVARSEERAVTLVGSHNLTRGGAFANFEAGVMLELDLRNGDDRTLLDDIDGFVDALLDDEATTLQLSPEALAQLLADPALRIGDEDAGRRAGDPTTDSDSVEGGEPAAAARLFTRSSKPRRPAPVPPRSPRAPTESPAPVSPRAVPAAPAPRAPAGVTHRWTKELSRADAQRPAARTSPTGHLTLVQAAHGIDQATYFRTSLFGSASWVPAQRGKEEAYLDFDVYIRGSHIGTKTIRLSHTPKFEAGQNNRTTVLHWGPLGDLLRRTDYTRDYVSIEALDHGGFRLTIDAEPTGPFRR